MLPGPRSTAENVGSQEFAPLALQNNAFLVILIGPARASRDQLNCLGVMMKTIFHSARDLTKFFIGQGPPQSMPQDAANTAPNCRNASPHSARYAETPFPHIEGKLEHALIERARANHFKTCFALCVLVFVFASAMQLPG